MKQRERLWGLMRAPRLVWDVLLRGRYEFSYDQMPMSVRGMSLAKRLNLAWAGANLVQRRLQPWSWPLHMQTELTSFCNLKCPVCPTGAGTLSRPAQSLDVDLFGRLMDEVGPYLLTLSLWGWGEPLLHPRLAEILRIASRYPVVTLLSTNGQNLMNPKVIDALSFSPPAHLIVAIDGLSDATNSQYRVGARLDQILAGVRRLAQIKQERCQAVPVLQMRYIVMRHNQHELPHLRDFARHNGFDLLTIRTLVLADSAEQKHRELVPDLEEFRAYEYAGDERVRRKDFVCQEPFWFPTVYADGTVVACDQDCKAQLPFGRLSKEVSFADVWHGEQAANARRVIRDVPASLSFCRNCPFADRQGAACSIQSFKVKQGDA